MDAHNYKLFEAAKARVEYVTVLANERAASSGTVAEQDLKSVLIHPELSRAGLLTTLNLAIWSTIRCLYQY